MAIKSNPDLKQFFSIKEVANMFKVSETLLRYWEREFPTIIKPKKGNRGIRMYAQKDIEDIRLVYNLVKERGMTLDGARKAISCSKGSINRQVDIIEHLKFIREELQAINKELNSLN